MTFHDHIRRYFLDVFSRPIHPPLDGVFVHAHRPTGGANPPLFGHHCQRLKHRGAGRAQAIEKGPFRLRKGLATGAAQVVYRALGALIGVAFQLTGFHLTEKGTVGVGTIHIVG